MLFTMLRFIFVTHFFAVVLLLSFSSSLANTINKDIVNKKVERNVDVASQLVKIQTKIVLENAGKSAASSVLYAVEPSFKDKLCFIGATKTGSSEEEDKNDLVIRPVQQKEHSDTAFWEIVLASPLEPGRTTVIEVETVFGHLLVPHPSHITQADKQLVYYRGNLHFFSPYPTTSQVTNVVLSSSNIESYTKVKPFTQTHTNISYGPYENIGPFSQSELLVHYENSSPFLSVSRLERVIEVSHWGNIAIEESVYLVHGGAILKGSFSRYEYQREQSGVASVKSFKQVLPAAATDVYYRDEIGNISTSHLRVLEDAVELDLRPRFPLFGGWKTHYLLGYNLPSYEYLFSSGEEFALKMRFVDHIFDDMLIEDVTVKIILPEGARDLQLNVPYEVQRGPDELHFTYLDTTGRPIVILHKNNLVENHIQEFELHYKFQRLLMLQEPLLVVVAFYLLFLLVIIYVRLDFSISTDKQSEGKLRVAGLCERVQQRQDKIGSHYKQLEDAMTHFKSSKDLNAFQTTHKKINAEHKADVQALQELQGKLKTECAEVADKVNELLKLDRLLKDSYSQQIGFTEKLVSNKLKKELYMDHLQTFQHKRDDVLEKIDTIIGAF